MEEITVDIDSFNRSTKVKAENNLQWYDTIKKEMLYFSGGMLSFEYEEDEFLLKMSEEEKERIGVKSNYRTLPKVVDMDVIKYKNITNEDKIEKFFKKYVKNNGSSISILSKDNKTMVFNVPDGEIEEFTEQLDRNSFRFSI